MPKFGAKEVMDVTLYNMATGAPVITFDTLKTSAIDVTSEKVYARGGKGNPKIITWEINKEATMTISDALLSPKSLELVSGMATATGSQTIPFRQNHEFDLTNPTTPVDKGDLFPLTCNSSGVINLAYTPTSAVSSIFVYLASDDCGARVDMVGASLSTNVLTLGPTGISTAGGKKVIVYYEYASPATSQAWTITSDKFAGTYKMVGSTVIRNAETGLDEKFYIICPNLKWSSDLKLDFAAEGDPQPTEFTVEIMRAAGSSTMIQLIKA
jgi:hypothetical protein